MITAIGGHGLDYKGTLQSLTFLNKMMYIELFGSQYPSQEHIDNTFDLNCTICQYYPCAYFAYKDSIPTHLYIEGFTKFM